MEIIGFVFALLLGGIASWQIFNWIYGGKLKKNKDQELRVESNVLLERIEKVFKVVVAEGYFTEIYDHKSSKDVLGLGILQSNKKALVIAKAKVSMGFDFSKMKSHRDEFTRKLIIDEFPAPEILSIDPEYKFYDINEGWLHKFKHDEYTEIINQAKKMMVEKAQESELPQIANKQISVMINQLAASMNWEVKMESLPNKTPLLLNE